MARYTWRKNKEYDGLGRYPASYTLRFGGKELAVAQAGSDGWFWYGDGKNTAFRPDTLEKVKAEAVAHFKAKS